MESISTVVGLHRENVKKNNVHASGNGGKTMIPESYTVIFGNLTVSESEHFNIFVEKS